MAATERNSCAPIAPEESTPKRGRPPGEVSPEALLKQELIAHLRLYRKMRELVETRLDDAAADPDLLAKYMELLRRGIADMVKPFVAAAKPETARPQDEEDGEKILARLLESK